MTSVAADLAPLFAKGAVVALEGDLGAGKTALARALIRIYMNDPNLEVPSPTFTLLQTYDSPHGPIWHFDLYRLKHPEEVFELGWEDALASYGIILIEWAEKMGPLLLNPITHITITPQNDNSRKVEVRG